MNNILNGSFISALTPDNNQNNNSANLADLFNEFRDNLLIICKTPSNFEDLFILLTELSGIFDYAIHNTEDKREIFYSKRAKCLVEGKIKLLQIRRENPELFNAIKNKSEQKPLRWGGTQTELSELLVALDLQGVILDSNKAKVPFTQLVKNFESIFDIRLGDSRHIKRNILSRKTKLTIFLDTLRCRL